MTNDDPDQRDETTHERPSSFREMLLRDRRLISRRQMDRRLRNRAAERNGGGNGDAGSPTTYFRAMSRLLRGGTGVEARVVVAMIVVTLAAFLFGRWVGQQDMSDPAPQSSGIVLIV